MNHTERRLAWRRRCPANAEHAGAGPRGGPERRALRTSACARQRSVGVRRAGPRPRRRPRPPATVTAIAWAWNEICACSRKSSGPRRAARCSRPMLCRAARSSRSRSGRACAARQQRARVAQHGGGSRQQLALELRRARCRSLRSRTLSATSDVHHSSSSTAFASAWSGVARPVGRNGDAVNTRDQLVLGVDAGVSAAPR